MRLFAATVLVALMLADLAVAAWHSPVPGSVTRPFDLGSDPFEAGRHRGVDLGAPPGTTVRARMRRPGRLRRHGRVERPGGHRAVRTLAGDPHAARLDRGPPGSHGPRGSAARHPCPLARARRPAPRRPPRRHEVRLRRPPPLPGPRPPNRAATRPCAPADPATTPGTAPTTGAAPTRAPPGTAPPRPVAAPPRTLVPPRPVAAPPRALIPPRPVAAPPAATGSNRRARSAVRPVAGVARPRPRARRRRHPRARAFAEGSRAGGGGRPVAREGREARGGWLASDARWPSTSPRRSTT